MTSPKYTNALIHETSPYLLQHAHNPVEWKPWSDAALAQAKDEDKLILVSVGYAACHWCHVMEHESFEDSTVAAFMNEHFICIKVDREERPDVDEVYMAACQLSSQRGCGWPLNAFALPDGRPFFAATYFPKDQWMNVMQNIITSRKKKPQEMVGYADNLQKGIEEMNSFSSPQVPLAVDASISLEAARAVVGQIDLKTGGRQTTANKFPMPVMHEFLLKQHHATGYEAALKVVDITLDNMARGGIYDQVGGGFSRYSVDPEWHVPHFEKMLYDNSQIVSLYSHAYQLTANPQYARVVRETLVFVERELSAPDGGFYSSLDADSEGEEGKYYVWTRPELNALLGDDAELYATVYDATKRGNWEHGVSVLRMKKSMAEFAQDFHLSESTLLEKLAEFNARLYTEREKRIRPGTDDKILTEWNALMVTAYVDAARALQDDLYLEIAIRQTNFLLENQMNEEGKLFRSHKNGASTINAFLVDYATMIEACLALYQSTFDQQWLVSAERMTEYVLQHFISESSSLLYMTSDEDNGLFVRAVVTGDNVIPSPNAIFAGNLIVLGTLLDKSDYIKRAQEMVATVSTSLTNTRNAGFYSRWHQVAIDLHTPKYEVAILGDNWKSMLQELQAEYSPNVIYLGGSTEGSLSLLKNKLIKGQTTIYVCQNKTCKLPVTSAREALQQLY